MARAENQKSKILYLKKLLEEQSDEEHPLSAQTLIDKLDALGIPAERKSIYADIACLQEFGMDILLKRGASGGYYLASREFELPEIKLLIDAVQSSRFLSERKSAELSEKLSSLVSQSQRKALRRQTVLSGRIKSMNESVYYNVDSLHEAIAANSQIRFRYFDWTLKAERCYRPGVYTASPYALYWDNEYYYLIAHSERHGLTHFRVDKMTSISQTGQPRFFESKNGLPDLSQYGKSVFGMFSGKKEKVKLRFHNSLTGVVIDRFGRDALLIPDGDEHFLFTADITVSPTFFGWLSGFGGRAKILWPESVQREYMELCKLNLSQYE